MPDPVAIRVGDISHASGTVKLSSPALVNHLIHNKEEAVALLSAVHPVRLNQISIDKQGRVVVANAKFAEKVKANLKGVPDTKANNGVCGVGCGSKESLAATRSIGP